MGRVLFEAYYANINTTRSWDDTQHTLRLAWVAAAFAARHSLSSVGEWPYNIFFEYIAWCPDNTAVERWEDCDDEFKQAWGDATRTVQSRPTIFEITLSTGALDFDEDGLSLRARLYVGKWRSHHRRRIDRIPLGPPGERYVGWTDGSVVEVYDWRVYRKVDGMPLYRLPQAAICLPLDIEVIADMHYKLQHGDPEMIATFNDAVDHGISVHSSVVDGVHRTGL